MESCGNPGIIGTVLAVTYNSFAGMINRYCIYELAGDAIRFRRINNWEDNPSLRK
jgi:hypothetical protein